MIRILNKNFKPRIKARIRKNRQALNKNLDNCFKQIENIILSHKKNITIPSHKSQ